MFVPDFQLRTERLVLQLLCPKDAQVLHNAAKAAAKSLPHALPLTRLTQPNVAEKFIDEGQQTAALGIRYQLGCFTAEKQEFLGNLNIDVHAIQGLNLGYWCAPIAQQQGFMTEAVHTAVAYVFQQPDVYRVEAQVSELNPASRRVLEKNGFQFEGTRRNGAFIDEQVLDMHIYAHTPQSWDSFQLMKEKSLA